MKKLQIITLFTFLAAIALLSNVSARVYSYSDYSPDGVEFGYGLSANDYYAQDYKYTPNYEYRYPYNSYSYYEPSYRHYDYDYHDRNWQDDLEAYKFATRALPADFFVDTSGWDYWKTPDTRTSREAFGDVKVLDKPDTSVREHFEHPKVQNKQTQGLFDNKQSSDSSASDWGNKPTYNIYDYYNSGRESYTDDYYYNVQYDSEKGYYNWRF
ncbi:MAG: hypothetical protein Q7S74_03310 [Nanoarchaeota archaeon]|nr:hypothetical protein [Nanoarchaeota archaeon]